MLSGPAGIDPSRLFDPFDIGSRRAIVAAVSGGGDSVALLVLLKSHLDRFAPATELVAVTIDHGMRPGSAGEALGVARLCADIGVAHRTLGWTEPKPATGLAAAAREARYRLLQNAADTAATDLLFTGHTADDQAETVAMRATRDAGRGLAGMAPATLYDGRTWFTRPLLTVRRAALRDYLRSRAIGWIDDPTNENHAFERPRIRAQLRGDPGLIDAALRDAEAAALRRERLGEAAALLIRRHARRLAPGLIGIDPDFLEHDAAAAIYALRILLACVGGTPYLPDETRTAALHGRLAGAAFRAVLSRALVDRRRDGIFLLREARGLPAMVEAAEGMVWDGRFRISGEAEDFLVSPLGIDGARKQPLVEGSAPQSLVHAALAAEPALWRGGGQSQNLDSAPHPYPLPVKNGERGASALRQLPSPRLLRGKGPAGDEGQRVPEWKALSNSAGLTLTPLIAPWSRFLPSFDLAPARAVGDLIGAAEIPPPPLREHIGSDA